MKNKKMLTILSICGVCISMLTGCNSTPATKVVEKKVTIDYTASPEQILSLYSNEGMKEFKNLYSINVIRNYALSEIGQTAPDFQFTDIKGNAVNLSNLKGKKIILDILKSTCSECKTTTPIFEKTIKSYSGVTVIPIFPKDNKTDVEDYYKETNLSVNTSAVAGTDNTSMSKFIENYGLTSIPTMIYIDETGKISYINIGSFDEHNLQDYYNTAFGKNKLYDMVKKQKFEVDKDGKIVKKINK